MSTTHVDHERLKMANHGHVENGHNEQMEKEDGSNMMAMDPHMMHHIHAKRSEQQVSQQKEQKRSFMDLVTAPTFVKRFMMNRYAIKTLIKGQDTLIKKKMKVSSYIRKFRRVSVAKSYMTNGLIIYC